MDKPCSFLINPEVVEGNENFDVVVLSPEEHKPLHVKSSKVPKGLLCEFIPENPGPHTVLASINNKPVDGSPSTIVVQDINRDEDAPIKLKQVGSLKSEKPYRALEEAIVEMKVRLV